MNDISDYFQILQSLLASHKQWNQVPQIVSLSFKAVSHILTEYKENFAEHKTLINQQSLKIKQQQLRLGNKLGKKQFQNEINSYMKNHQGFKNDDESASQYEKLTKLSRYSRHEKQKLDHHTIQQFKTISQLIAQKKISELQKSFCEKIFAQKQQLQQKIGKLHDQIKSSFLDNEKQFRQLRQRVNGYQSSWNRLEQSNIRLIHSISQEKIVQLQNSNKVLSNNINQIINHLQNNYVSKEQMEKIQYDSGKNHKKQLINKEKQKNNNQFKDKNKNQSKEGLKIMKMEKQREQQTIKLIENCLSKAKQKQYKEWYQFKQNMLRQMTQSIKMQTINQLLDKFQKQMLEKHQTLSNNMSKIQRKINKNQQKHKQIITKSQKRAQKNYSPQKSLQNIQQTISKLQKTLCEKKKSQNDRIVDIVGQNIDKYDKKMMKELDRRQKHLCQVIQETYNQNIDKINDNPNDIKSSIKRVFENNIFCRYLYHGVNQCKKDSTIIWQQQIQNSLTQNFLWKKDTILINSSGVYKIQLALFGQIQSQTHILLNQVKIAVVNRPELTKNTGLRVKGSYFSQIFLLPNKSRISIKVNQLYYGKGYLSVQKL